MGKKESTKESKQQLVNRIKEQEGTYDRAQERYEIIEGIRYELYPAPTVTHQKIAAFLHRILASSCERDGIILFAPLDVFLDEKNSFQPDLVYISYGHEHIIKEARIEGAPDLVVEILSPSTGKNDKVRKKRQYERFGVREYWIVDPVHETIDQFVLKDEQLMLLCTYSNDDTVTSELFTCISVPVDELFKPLVRPTQSKAIAPDVLL